jgi:hypothetical protein
MVITVISELHYSSNLSGWYLGFYILRTTNFFNMGSYNERKVEILRYISEHQTRPHGICPLELERNLGIPHTLAKVLLHNYRRQKLLFKRRRASYRISKRGLARLEYLEKRLDITDVTGIDIGLNHNKPLPKPQSEIIQKYLALGGTTYPGFTL